MGIIRTVIIIGLLAFAFIVGFMANGLVTNLGSAITGKVTTEIPEIYTLTKAHCNNNNECIDLTIACEDDKVIDIVFSSGLVQLPDNWTDPRSQEEIERLCENGN